MKGMERGLVKGGALLIQLDEFSVNIMDHRYKYRVFFNNNSKKNIESG